MRRKEKHLTREETVEMFLAHENIRSAKEAREFHKKYKAYGYGLYIDERYPWIRTLFLVPALVFSLISLVLSFISLFGGFA